MRREGEGFEAIGARLGMTRANARKLVGRELQSLAAESNVEERRLLHVEVLMELWRVLYASAMAGDRAAIDQFLRVEERISRLFGLDLGSGTADETPVQILVGSQDRGESMPDPASNRTAPAPPAARDPGPGNGGLD